MDRVAKENEKGYCATDEKVMKRHGRKAKAKKKIHHKRKLVNSLYKIY